MKIKNYFTENIACNRILLILFAIFCFLASACTFVISSHYHDLCYNETHTEQVENVETERNIIERDINNAKPTSSDYLTNIGYYDYPIYFNSFKSYNDWVAVFELITFYDVSSFGINVPIYPIACNTNSINEYSVGLWVEKYSNTSYSIVFANLYNFTFIYLGTIDINNFVLPNLFDWDYGYLHPLLEDVLPIGNQNNLLWNYISTKPFETENTSGGDGLLPVNSTNYNGYMYFNEYLSGKEFLNLVQYLPYNDTYFMYDSFTEAFVPRSAYTIYNSTNYKVIIVKIPSDDVVIEDSYFLYYVDVNEHPFNQYQLLMGSYDFGTAINKEWSGWVETNTYYTLVIGTFPNQSFGTDNIQIAPIVNCNDEIEDTSWYINFMMGYGSASNIIGNQKYTDGFNDGYSTGYDVGKDDGYIEGFDEGFELTGDNHLNATNPIMNFISKGALVVSNTLNIEILPNITLGTILLFPLAIALLWFCVKLFMGG